MSCFCQHAAGPHFPCVCRCLLMCQKQKFNLPSPQKNSLYRQKTSLKINIWLYSWWHKQIYLISQLYFMRMRIIREQTGFWSVLSVRGKDRVLRFCFSCYSSRVLYSNVLRQGRFLSPAWLHQWSNTIQNVHNISYIYVFHLQIVYKH